MLAGKHVEPGGHNIFGWAHPLQRNSSYPQGPFHQSLCPNSQFVFFSDALVTKTEIKMRTELFGGIFCLVVMVVFMENVAGILKYMYISILLGVP